MEEKLPCDIHGEQLRNLFEKDIATNKKFDEKDLATNKRVDRMDWMRDTLTKLTTLMEITIEDSRKRDEDSKKRDSDNKITNEKQNETLGNMNRSLIEINNSMNSMNTRIGALEEKVEEGEGKNLIDLRDISKKKYTDVLFRYILPTGGGVVILLEILKVWKG